MAKDKETLNGADEDKEDLDVVEVEKLPTAAELAARAETGDDADAGTDGEPHDDLDDEDEEDSRLVDADASDDEKTKAAKEKRKKRRDAQKAARDRTLHELDSTKRELADLKTVVQKLVGNQTNFTDQQLTEKIAAGKQQIAEIDVRIAQAVERGDGAAMAAAMTDRDTVRDNLRTLEATQTHLKQSRETAPSVDTDVKRYADSWRAANPWYNAPGNEAASAVVNRIDNQLTAEGLNPKSEGYWKELSRRVGEHFETARGAEGRQDQRQDRGARRAPPVGTTRPHVPDSTRNEVYVTPERKAAMIEAGIWDDPDRRRRALKAYRDFDAQQAGR